VTAGGLVFIVATSMDGKLRAFDEKTGELLGDYAMAFAGNATRNYMLMGSNTSSSPPAMCTSLRRLKVGSILLSHCPKPSRIHNS
jgi:hypothetical protein